MTVPIYATPVDLAAWQGLYLPDGVTGDPSKLPVGAVAHLRSACAAVRERTVTWFFPADPVTGLAIDSHVAGSMQNATLYQAAALIALEVDATLGGTLEAVVETSAKLGSASTTVAGTAEAAASRNATITGLCPAAARELRLAGMPSNPWMVG